MVTGLGEPREVRLYGDRRKLAVRRVDLYSNASDRAAWAAAREALVLHDTALVLERGASGPGAIPLPPDHVPAAEHFMAAVHALFPDYAAAAAPPEPG